MKWNAICDRCGSKRLNHELRKQWNNLMVCADTCWEPRNQQDFVRGVVDRQNPPWVRPEPADVFEDTFLLLREDGGLFIMEVSSMLSVDDDALALES